MGNNSSAVKDVGISDEVDERLVSCNEEIFEDGFLKRHARDYKRIRFKKFNTRAETTGPVFGFRPHTKKVQHELMDDIATLGNDRKANAYSLEIEKRIHAIKKIHNAVRREIIRDRNRTQASANALKNRIETDAPPLPASAKIGIKTSVKMFLILIKSAQHTDANVMDDILSLLCEILDDTAPLTLIDGPNFSPDIANGLSPLLDFIRSLITNKSHSLERRAKATKVLFNVALARGSLVEFLSLCRVLLVSDQVGNARDVMGSLRYLINHRPTGRAGIQDLSTQAKDQPSIPVSQPERRHSLSFVGPNVLSSRRRSTAGMQFPFYTYDDEKKMTETQEHEDAPGIFPSSPAEIMQRCAPNLESLEGNDSIDGRLAALIVIAQIDRLSQPYARQPDEDIWNDDPNRLAVLYKPLCVDVKPETLAALSDIIDLVSPGYFSSDACPDSKYIPNMYMLVACLKILKVHLYQTVRAKLPQNEFNISPAAVDRIRKQIFRFLETSSAPRSNNLVMISTAVSDAVQSEAAQILAEAFEFFYSSVSDQVVYLGKLIDKFNSSENGQKQSLSNPEQDLLELLLSRFSSFSSGSLLLDELELACTHDPPAASSRVVMEVLKSLVSASVHEVESALKCTSKTHQESNILLILQNFQKHLLSRAGTYLVFPKDATETSNPGIRINRNSNPSPESASLSAEEERPSTNGSAGTRSFNMSPDPSSDAVQDSAGSSVMADTSLSSPASTGPNSSAVEVSSSAQPSGERGTNDDENVLEEDPEKIRISSAVLNVVWEYSKSLIDASLGVLSFAHDIIIQDQTSEGLRRVGEDVLRESLICKLTRPLIATLCVFIGQIDGSEMALKLLPSVSLFLMKCDNLWCLVREISQPEDEMSVDKKRIVQSRHPYRNNVEREEVITIKDAQQLIVTFDITKCSTQSEEDYVQLFKSPNKRDPITERLYGPADGSNWPAESIHVNGDTVAVFFHSGASGTGWGYRITVLGTVIVTPLSWLRDFTQNVSWLCGKMGASLISGLPVSPAEKELQGSVLVLFKSGVEPTHPLYPCLSPVISDLDPSISKMFPEIQNSDTLEPTHCQGQISEMAFLQSIISDTGTGQVLLSNLNTLMPDRHIVQRSILNQANKAIAGVFAVLLKHTHRVKLAMSLVSEGDKCKAPECILRLWKKAQEMKLELRSLKAQGEDIDEWLTAILNRVNFLLHIRADDGFIFESGSLADVTDTTNSRRSISSGLKGFSEHGLVSETAGSLTALTSSDEGHVGSANHFDVSEMIITNENDADSGFSSLSVSRSNSITELTGPMLMMQKTNKWTQSKVMTKLLKNTMKALRRLKELMLVRTRLASVKQDPESVLIRSVIKFIITRHVDLEAIMEGLIVQRTRAVLRVIGLHYFSILVKGVKSDGLLPELLLHFNSAFRQSPETGNKSVKVVKKHFTANIPTAGSCLIEYLSETYFDIAGSLITQPNLDDVSKLHLLDICNIEFNPQDLKLLHRIGITRYLSSFLAFPGTNRAVLDNQELFKDLGLGGQFRSCPWNIRFSSWSLFRMLAYAASSLASPPYECLDQIFNTALNQMSLIWKMRQHQQMLLAKLLSVTNENDKMTTDSSSSPINWYCRRCAFFNDQATSECEICSLTFQDNENLAKQDVQIEEFEHKGQEFVYEADFDTRGILYYLGTCGNTEPWRNPHELGTVCVTGSSQQSDSNPISAVVGRTAVRCVSQPSPNQWFAIDFLEHSIIPTHYTLRHYSSWDTEALRFWNLEGSNDGTNWITLRVHNNDRSLDKRGATHTWDIPNITDSYSHFRVYMTGLNSNEHWYLALSGFEIYGILDGDAEYISSKKQHPERSSGTSSDFWDIRDTREIEFSGPSQDKPVTIMHTNNTESWHTVKGVQAYSSGRHLIEFRVEFDGNGSNSWKFIIGVVPQRFMINNASTWIGSQGGWGYIGGLGHKNYNSSTNRPYGAAYTAGDTIGIQLDFDSGTIEFFKNGASQGIAFDNLTGPVFAAVSMTGYQSKVTMLQPPPVEEDHKIVEIDRSSWHIRIREANLGDASVYWFKNHFDDVGLRGRPLVRKEAPVVGELDAFFNQYLWLLLRCCQFPAVQRVLSSKPWIKIILEVAAHGSPVGKLLAVRICRYILPGISPSDDRLVSGSGAEAQSDAIGDGASVPGLSMNSKRTALISGFLERAAGASFHIPIRSGSVGIDGWSRQHEFEESESSNRQAAIEASLLQYKQRCGGRSGPASLSFSVKRGTIEIDGWHHLKATMGFATAVADVSVISGKWYFEAVLETAGLQQIGFVKTEFSPVGAGDGVGDDKVSWAFDGMRSKKWHDGSAPYGGTAPWKTGDVVGVLLNMDEGELRYTLCGVDLGVAFTDLKLNGSGAVFPAVSMSAGESLRFIFDSSKFLQTCPEGYYPWIGDKPTVQQHRSVPWSIESDAIGSEYVSLSRVLIRSTLWKTLFNEVLWNGLQNLSTLHSDLDSLCQVLRMQRTKDLDWNSSFVPAEFCTSLRLIVSALSVLGGNIESVRQGARVVYDSTDGQSLEGTVTSIVREPNKGSVVIINLDNGEDAVVTELVQLTARSNVELSLSHVRNPADLIKILGNFLSTSVTKHIYRFPTARQIFMQIQRQALKVLLSLFENSEFVALFIEAGFGQLIGKKALSASIPLADGLINMISNLEPRALALEKRRRELHDPECADEQGAVLRFFGDIHYSRALGQSDHQGRKNIVSFDDGVFLEQVVSSPTEARISEVCVWADNRCVYGIRASYIIGDDSTEMAPRHLGSANESSSANIVSLKSDEFIVRIETISVPLSDILPGGSSATVALEANVIATLILTTNHDSVHTFGRQTKEEDLGDLRSVVCQAHHGVVAFFGTVASHLESIGLIERPVKRVKIRHFTYQDDLDENGIVFFLGCKNGTSTFQNPMTLGLVEVTVARIKADSHHVSAVVGREAVRCLCNDMNNAWFAIDFKRYLIRPNKYTLRHYSSWDTEALRSWKFQGSVDGTDWVVLRDHVDDASLNKKGQAHSWDLPGISQFYRHFRILMTGKNSNNHNYLSLSGFEIYGDLLEEIAELRSVSCSSLDSVQCEDIQHTSEATSDDGLHNDSTIARRDGSSKGLGLSLASPSNALNIDLLNMAVAASSAQTEIEPGQVYSFGHGGSGRLGHGNNSAVQIPKLIDGFDGRLVTSISCFNQHVLALTENGQVYSWGNNQEGRLGHGDTVPVTRPKLIQALEHSICVQVCAGNSFSVVLDSDHHVWVFGKGNEGQMGNGSISDQKVPIQVKGILEFAEITRIGVGAFHCLALTASGELYSWGRNLRGQLGLNSTAKKKLMPEKVQHCPSFVEVRGGWDHSMALTSSGQLYSWGNGYEGSRPATGHGTNQNILAPKLVQALKNKVVVRISTGWDHSMALTKDGEAYLWGGNASGVLGNGTTNQESTPKLLVDEIGKEKIVWIDGAQYHTCAVTEKGELWLWGSLLGSESRVPKKVEVPYPNLFFQYVICGDKANYAVSCESPKKVPPTPVVAIGATDITYPPYPQSAFLLGPPSKFFVGFAAVKPPVIPASRAPRLDVTMLSTDGGQHSDDYKASNVFLDNEDVYCTTAKRNVNIVAEPDPAGHVIYLTAVSARNPDPETFTAPLLSALVFVLDDLSEVAATVSFDNFTAAQYSSFIAQKQSEDSEPLATEPVAFIDLSATSNAFVQCDLVRAGKYILFKLVEPRTKETNIDVEFLAAYGYLDELPLDMEHTHINDKRKSPQDALLEEDARKRQEVRNFVSDIHGVFKGPITVDEDLKLGGLYPSVTGGFSSSFSCDPEMPAPGVTICIRFKPSQNVLFSMKSYATLLSIVLPESDSSAQLLCDPTFRQFQLVISGGGLSDVSEEIIFEDMGDEWHHAVLVIDRRCLSVSEKKSICVSAFIDGALVCSLVIPTKGMRFDVANLLPLNGNASFGCGINGQIREAGIWGFALDAKQVHDLCQSSLEFCQLDFEETALHIMHVQTYRIHPKNLSAGVKLSGEAEFYQLSSDSANHTKLTDTNYALKNPSDSECFVSLLPNSGITIERSLGRKPLMDSYTLIADINIPNLPSSTDCCLIQCASAALVVKPDGRFDVLGRISGKKSTRKIFPNVWYRVVFSVDLQKGQIFVFTNGMLAASLAGDEHFLSKAGPFSLPVSFDICRGNSVPVFVRRIQLRSKPLSQSNAIRLRSADESLEDGRDINAVARSLLKMGYPMRWCTKALASNSMNRRLASDYILKNATSLHSEDRLEEHNKAAQTLSLMGFPRKLCAVALSKVMNNTSSAILYLLDNVDNFSDSELCDEECSAQGSNNLEDDAHRNLNIEKNESTNAAFKILKSTKENMEATLDELVQRSIPKRTVDYPELQTLNKNELYSAMAATEEALSITYSRRCVLSMLQNWPTSNPLSLRIFGDDEFLVKFIRLIEFSQPTDGLDVLRASLHKILEREDASISEVISASLAMKPTASNSQLGNELLSISMLKQFAPISRQLLAEALHHMVGIISDPHSKILNETDALHQPNPGLIIWILNIFTEFVQDPSLITSPGDQSREQLSVIDDDPLQSVASKTLSHLGRIVFSGPVVNLIFEVIAVSSGDQRLSFVRLLSHLIRLGIQFDSNRSCVLKDLMNHMHVAQSSKGIYSSFFQALIELNVSMEKIEQLKLQKQPSSEDDSHDEDRIGPVSHPSDLASPSLSESAVVAEDPIQQGIQFTYSEDMDANGILYYLGTNQNTTAWANPSELGVVKVTASSLMLDSKPASAVVGREAVRCVTKPMPNQWFAIDFLDHSITPTYYTLRHYSSWDTEALRSWKLEGSHDGVTWVVLREHRNDSSLARKGQTHSWPLLGIEESYSQFRIIMTDQNSNQHWYLSLSGFEIYGTLDGDALAWEEEEKEFVYASDLDTNGILYFLGTNELTDSWQNPAETGLVRVEACSLQHNSAPKSAIVGREAVRCVSQPNQDQWFVIDFLDRRIIPSKYTLRHYNSYDTEALRNWRLEGSTDGTNWVCLREHRDDCSLQKKGQTHTWDITMNQPAESYSKFRIFMFGKNSNDHWYLALSGFEIYGRMLVRTGQRTKTHQTKGKLRNKPWFESVLLVDNIVRCILCKESFPRPFSKKIWKQITSWPSEKVKISNADEDDISEFDSIMSKFSRVADEDLVHMINRLVEKSTLDPMHMKANELEVKQEDLLPYRSLEEIPLRDLQIRLFTIQQLNVQISSVMSFVDFSIPTGMSTLADGIRAIRGLIFFRTKEVLWNRALDETKCSPSDRELELDRFRAVKLRESRKMDVKGQRSLFGQAFQQLNNRDPKMFRLEKSKCAWKTVFKGEFSDDYGGPYRNSIEDFCNELHSDLLPLFIRCPNGRENIGTNREKYVPRPSSVSPLHLAMYEFVGKLMGLAIRTKNVLDLDLPSIVWKPLVSDVITEEDVLSIDLLSFKILDELKKFENSGDLPPEYFTACVNSKFVVIGSDQRIYPLVPGGHHIQVTWENRHQFSKALIHYRLNEFKIQCEAIKRGLATVVPYPLLSLFTWHELEVEVCGRPKMNIDLLEQMAIYESCSSQDPHIILFWKMLRECLDDVERCQFLRFVWGRSRLPLKQEDFDRKFKISRMHQADRSPDDYLPISHTCFFSLELPRYSSLDVMHKKILYAITHCVAIDADDTSVAQDAARRSADVDVDSENDSENE